MQKRSPPDSWFLLEVKPILAKIGEPQYLTYRAYQESPETYQLGLVKSSGPLNVMLI